MSLVVAIPTRNRSVLALAAVRNLLGQRGATHLRIVVSDNSTQESEVLRLRKGLEDLDGTDAFYLRPSRPLSMGEHWDWMIDRSLQTTEATHFSILTDRMVFRRTGLAEVIERVRSKPDAPTSYNIAEIHDAGETCRVNIPPWTGDTLDVPSDRLLAMAAKGWYHPAVPRLLNSVVPREVILEVKARFGSICDSAAPDVCFGFRCLTVRERIRYYDARPLVQYALARSNGVSAMRGIVTADLADFLSTNGSLNWASPEPRLMTISNAVIHEYCRVRREVAESPHLPPPDLPELLRRSKREMEQMLPGELRQRNEAVLREHGYLTSSPPDERPSAAVPPSPGLFRRLLRRISRGRHRALDPVRRQVSRRVWRFLAAWFGIQPGDIYRFWFDSSEEALNFALVARGVPTRDRSHLAELEGEALSFPRRR